MMLDLHSNLMIRKLHPRIRQFVTDVLFAGKKRGVYFKLTHGFRTFAAQDRLFAQGRTVPGRIVTYARGGESYHNYGLAVDVCMVRGNGSVSYSIHEDLDKDGVADWNELAEEFERCGFAWGGRWKKMKDYTHFEMSFGKRPKELLALVNARIVDENGYVIL